MTIILIIVFSVVGQPSEQKEIRFLFEESSLAHCEGVVEHMHETLPTNINIVSTKCVEE